MALQAIAALSTLTIPYDERIEEDTSLPTQPASRTPKIHHPNHLQNLPLNDPNLDMGDIRRSQGGGWIPATPMPSTSSAPSLVPGKVRVLVAAATNPESIDGLGEVHVPVAADTSHDLILEIEASDGPAIRESFLSKNKRALAIATVLLVVTIAVVTAVAITR